MTSKISQLSPSNNTAAKNAGAGQQQPEPRNQRTQPTQKLFVDKEGNKQISGVVQSIAGALSIASSNTVIKITGEIYNEELVITKPNITLEPKSEAHDVILVQNENPCIVVDVGEGNLCTINNIKMMLKGPNRDYDSQNFLVDMNFEKKGSQKCMQEFFTHKPEEMYCIILVRSGTLVLNGCQLTLDGVRKETYRKVPCIAALPLSRLEITGSTFKGDLCNDSETAGIISMNCDVFIKECTLAFFKSGGIMVQAQPQNSVVISDNQILSCETNGIYIQGRATRVTVKKNKINFNHCTAIFISVDVDANIFSNELTLNTCAIEIFNNKSKLIDNIIEKSFEDGIRIIGNDKTKCSAPLIWRNTIKACALNGILATGEQASPDIRGNIIIQNRKSGIKITELAQAHIGGTSKVDIKFIPSTKKTELTTNSTFQTAKVQAVKIYLEQENLLFAQLEDDVKKDELLFINVKSFPNPNVISSNFNQGILIVEGSSAKIISNKIDSNIKANIALGGKDSGKTRIKYNYIEDSKTEGIFVLDGEDRLVIEDNQISGNYDGIVMVCSQGLIKDNVIKSNSRAGLMTCSKTFCVVDSNIIEENLAAGILIKNPSLPDLRRNEISKNFFQVQMEWHAKKRWGQYVKDNPKIIGKNEVPVSTCNIF